MQTPTVNRPNQRSISVVIPINEGSQNYTHFIVGLFFPDMIFGKAFQRIRGTAAGSITGFTAYSLNRQGTYDIFYSSDSSMNSEWTAATEEFILSSISHEFYKVITYQADSEKVWRIACYGKFPYSPCMYNIE